MRWAGWRVVVALALALPFFWRLDAEEFHGDESHWITSGQQAFYLVTSGQTGDRQWRDEFYFYSQPQVGKLLLGAAVALAGRRGPTPIYDYDWQRTPAENLAAGRIPPGDAVIAGRLAGAAAGWLTCLLLWTFGAAIRAPAAGMVGAVLLASHPLWLANSRRAGLDAIALCLGLLAAWAAVRALQARHNRAAWWLLAGGGLGLAAGAKYVGLLSAAGVLVPAIRRLTRPGRWATLAGGAAALTLAGLVFYTTNPALYGHPLTHLAVSLSFLTTQAAGMRESAPVFASPLLIAAEIVDRVIWPTGYPVIVDTSLPDVLRPGSYGTPTVAAGAALALLLARRIRRQTPLGWWAAVGWTAVVFVLLALSIPTWWERWHLPLLPPLCLLAGVGLAALGNAVWADWRLPLPGGARVPAGYVAAAALPAAQFVAALAMEPSFLGRGMAALVGTPLGLAAHLLGLAVLLCALVSLGADNFQHRRRGRGDGRTSNTSKQG